MASMIVIRTAIFAAIFGMVGTVAVGRSAPQRPRPATLRYPLVCARIKVGVSTDADVRRLYGKGYFVPAESHSGGRYYVDPRHTATLHTEIGVDSIIESLEYRQGVHLPRRSRTVLAAATTPRLSSHEKVEGGIGLGDVAVVVLQKYGRPKSDKRHLGARVVKYEATEGQIPGVLAYEATFRFGADRLVSVSLYNGE